MSTIDLTQVSGLRAVDAEGNDLGPVSLQDLTDSITIQVLQTLSMRQQAATLEEPALLSASAQSAGSDTYENQLPEQTDLKWARALDASGNPILISKESLASVVGGRLDVSALKLRTYHLENGATIDTGISQKGLVVIGNNDYYSGDISVFMNNHSSAELVYLGSNRTPHIKVFKDARDSNMKITNESNGHALDVYIRIYPLL